MRGGDRPEYLCKKKFNLLIFGFTVKPLNKGHIADRPFVSCREKQINFSAHMRHFFRSAVKIIRGQI